MSRRKTVCIGVAILGIATGRAQAQHGGMHHGSWHGWHGGGGHGNVGPQVFGLGAVGFYGGFYGGYAPMLAIGPGGFMPPVGWMGPPFMQGRGPLLPPPPPGMPGMDRNVKRANLKASDPARSEQLTTLGDRLFRAGNFKRAEERYLQAIRVAPDLAKPRFRLAQIAMMRGQYATAADAGSRGRNRAAGLDHQCSGHPGPLRRAGRFCQQRCATRDSSADQSRRPRRMARPGRRVVPFRSNNQGGRCLQETQRPQPQTGRCPDRLPRCLQPDGAKGG